MEVYSTDEIKIMQIFSMQEAKTHQQEAGYSIYAANANQGGEYLLEDGWYFSDRIIHTSLDLRKWNADFLINGGRKYHYIVTQKWDVEEIYGIASCFFQKDCRFALDREKADTDLKNKLLYRYISQLAEDDYQATCCLLGDKMIGFNLWNTEGQKGRVFLGAVLEEYQRTGVAVYLYGRTMYQMKENGVTELTNHLSTENLSSMNLHMRMAQGTVLRFLYAEDWYIKKWF